MLWFSDNPSMRAKSKLIVTILILAVITWLAWRSDYLRARLGGRATISDRQSQYGPAARARLRPWFEKAAVAYPPGSVTLVVIKESKTMEIWAAPAAGAYHHVRDYPILAASGHAGPKLREGDMQVPEGVYAIDSLNPNSGYHL